MMIGFILNGGPLAIVQVIFTFILLMLFTNLILQLLKKNYESIDSRMKTIKYNTTLILGLGVLGQVQGIYNALGEIAKASDISPKIIFEGVHISFSTTLFGLWIFCLSYILMLVIRLSMMKK